jgi:hypothetical protein
LSTAWFRPASKGETGNFGEEGSYLNFSGEIKGGELQAQIVLSLEGTISGKLSADGQSLSGTYKFTVPPFDHGTWQARKQQAAGS